MPELVVHRWLGFWGPRSPSVSAARSATSGRANSRGNGGSRPPRRYDRTGVPVAIVRLLVGVVLSATSSAACSGDGQPLNSEEQLRRGELLYGKYCYQCHDGTGGIGSKLTRRGISTYSKAANLINYNDRYMPYGAENSLQQQQVVDITAYLLSILGYIEPGVVLTTETAADITLRE